MSAERQSLGAGEPSDDAQRTARHRLFDEVARWRGQDLPEFFWRDDDATNIVPSLERFLELADRRGVPIVFAAIPTLLTSGAARVIRSSRRCLLAVHGFAHANHAPAGFPDSEYPEGRAEAVVAAELRDGHRLVQDKAADRHLRMFVPPWGRFDASYAGLLTRTGFVAFSGDAASARYAVPVQLDCQILTEHGKTALGLGTILDRVTRQLEIRRLGPLPHLPIGLMTHHRTFGPELEDALEEFLDIIESAGFRFSDFSKFDIGVAAGKKPPFEERAPSASGRPKGAGASAWSPESALDVATALLERSLPPADEGLEDLRLVLSEIGRTSPIAALRYVHLSDSVSALPSGARVLSAGCGKGLSEVALALANPQVSWLAIDIDPLRYGYAREMARSCGLTNIRFASADLDRLDGPELGDMDAIVMSEVAMYLRDPARTIKDLRRWMKASATLTCIEPFLAEGEPELVEKLRQHTQSIHGGFTHERMRSFFSGMEIVSHTNCYFGAPGQLLKLLWDQMSASGDWGLMDLMFAVARLDLGGPRVNARHDATAIKVVARQPASP